VIQKAPLTAERRDKFCDKAFRRMKKDAIFMNIGRGAVVDEEALVKALQNEEIKACGLDVLREEPIDMQHPLLSMSNATILPHIGSASIITRDRIIQQCIDNIKLVLDEKDPKTPVV